MVYRYDNAVKQILDEFKAKPSGFVQKDGTYMQIKNNKLVKPEPWLHAQITGKKRSKDTHGTGSVIDFTVVIYVWDTRVVVSILEFSVANAMPALLFSKCSKAKDNHKPLIWGHA